MERWKCIKREDQKLFVQMCIFILWTTRARLNKNLAKRIYDREQSLNSDVSFVDLCSSAGPASTTFNITFVFFSCDQASAIVSTYIPFHGIPYAFSWIFQSLTANVFVLSVLFTSWTIKASSCSHAWTICFLSDPRTPSSNSS